MGMFANVRAGGSAVSFSTHLKLAANPSLERSFYCFVRYGCYGHQNNNGKIEKQVGRELHEMAIQFLKKLMDWVLQNVDSITNVAQINSERVR